MLAAVLARQETFPMTLDLSLTLAMFIAVALLSVVATRLRAAAPVFMLVAGVALSFVPGMPTVELDPDVVLLILLPPLLYSAGVNMSWRGFRANLRPILLLAVGCVLFTAAAVAAAVHYALGLSWAVGFVLGAIVSPPDALAPMAVLKRIGLPRRVLTILEGESLVNDATALVILSFALTALVSGQFSALAAASQFILIAGGEIAFGALVGLAALRLRHLANEPRAEILLALATPFVAFWPPHGLGGSGVVACVTAGLYVSWNGRALIRPATRLQGYFIWDVITWSIEALAFLLTGLQARAVTSSMPTAAWPQTLKAAALVCATIIIVRFIWVFPATYLPRWLFASIRRREAPPSWRLAFLVGFAGLRGVVSLAAALSIPLTAGNAPFPQRELILVVTLAVILVTLVGQGALLPWLVRWLALGKLGAREAAADKRQEQAARMAGLEAVLAALEKAERETGMPAGAVAALRRRHQDRRAQLISSADEATPDDPVTEATLLQMRLIGAERWVVEVETRNPPPEEIEMKLRQLWEARALRKAESRRAGRRILAETNFNR